MWERSLICLGLARLERLPLASAGERQERPDGSWLLLLGLRISGGGEMRDGPSATWMRVLLSALGAAPRLL